ncbi:hypothetical protein PS15p_211858 [Mucor circinelloides]
MTNITCFLVVFKNSIKSKRQNILIQDYLQHILSITYRGAISFLYGGRVDVLFVKWLIRIGGFRDKDFINCCTIDQLRRLSTIRFMSLILFCSTISTPNSFCVVKHKE